VEWAKEDRGVWLGEAIKLPSWTVQGICHQLLPLSNCRRLCSLAAALLQQTAVGFTSSGRRIYAGNRVGAEA